MIPFDKIYAWLFKSFSIHEESRIIEEFITEGKGSRMMLVKRSWIFIFFVIWMPVLVFLLSGISMWIAYDSIDILAIKYSIIIGNLIISTILIFSTFFYILHYRDIHRVSSVTNDPEVLLEQVKMGDIYFTRFFNWSLTNQFLLWGLVILEVILITLLQKDLWSHFWVLAFDTLVIMVEMYFLHQFRKRMIDLEMDFNIVIPGKLYTNNQSGVLSNTQTIDGDKIKTVRSKFPNKLSSFFNFGNVDILTEGDVEMMGTITMNFVTAPSEVAKDIESLLREGSDTSVRRGLKTLANATAIKNTSQNTRANTQQRTETPRHTLDTREKIRDILR